MAAEIVVPSFGESVSEAVLGQWKKRDGEYVAKGEAVASLESDKTVQDLPAPEAGIVRTSVAEGATVSVGTVLGRIEAGSPSAAPATPAKQPAAPPVPVPSLGGTVPSSPSVRAHAAEHGIDLTNVKGSGPGGRVFKSDLATAAAAAPAVAVAPAVTPSVSRNGTPGERRRETRTRMTGIRQRIAVRLLESQQTTAQLTTFNEVDLFVVNEIRAKYKESFKTKYGVGLGYSSFFMKAVIEALKAFPLVNSRIEGADVVTQHYYDISMAVSTDRGLVVPVIRDADQLSFAGIEKAVVDIAGKARNGTLKPDDLAGGTFTITNGGVFGSLLSTPILNLPQTAILGMHAIQRRPVAIGDDIVIRPMMYVALTYDHRLIDGKEAVQFLVKVKECLESPERMLLDI